MTRATPLWLQNGTYTAAEDRALIGAMWSTGVLGIFDLAVIQRQAGPNMSVDVYGPGGAIVEGTTVPDQGKYLCQADAVENVPIDAAPAAGQSRIDLIVARVRDSSAAGGDDDWIIEAITGTPTAGTPAAPAAPASSLPLAEVRVTGGAAAIKTADITDLRALAGNRADQGLPWLKPSFDGQLIVASGKLYLAHGGQWVWANEPEPAIPPDPPIVPNYPRVYQTTNNSFSVTKNATSTIMSVGVPAPGFDATIVATVQGQSGTSGSAVVATYRLRTTVSGAPTDHPGVTVTASSALQPGTIALVGARDITAAQAAVVEVRCQELSGVGVTGSGGVLVVQVLPR